MINFTSLPQVQSTWQGYCAHGKIAFTKIQCTKDQVHSDTKSPMHMARLNSQVHRKCNALGKIIMHKARITSQVHRQ